MTAISKSFRIQNKLGLHARAAAAFVKITNRYAAEVTVTKDQLTVNGKSIMGVLMLAAAKGSTIQVSANGDDAKDLISELKKLIENKFGEE